jgi:hypothetical protein
MSEEPKNPSGESKIAGVSIRSWNATTIIVIGTCTLAYLAIQDADPSHVMALVTGAVGYLFGKAGGLQQRQ